MSWCRAVPGEEYVMTMIFSCLVKLASAAAISSVGLSSPITSPALSPQGETVGVPTVGAVGITETNAQIMARDKVLNNYPILPKQEHEWELDKQPNPEAPAVPTWPPLPTAAPGDKGGQVKIQSPQPIGTQFTGATLANSGGFVPPDCEGASGLTDMVVVANTWIRSYSKTGVLGSLNTNMNNFFASVGGGSGTSDPLVTFDPLSQRYYVVMINLSTPNRVMLAVSTGPHANAWTFFQFQHDLIGTTPNSDTGGFCDYPSLGVDANAVYVGANIFNATGTAYIGSTVYVIRKSSVLGAGPIVATPFRQVGTGGAAGPYSPRGVSNTDPAATVGWFVGVDTLAFSLLQFRRISTPAGTPTISANLPLTVPTTAFASPQPNQGGTRNLDVIDDRLFQASIRRNRWSTGNQYNLWTSHHIRTNSSGTGTAAGDRNSSRWYQIDLTSGSPVLLNAGTLVPPAASGGYIFPSVNMNGQGHMALGATFASPTSFGSVAAAGRLRTDIPTSATQPATIATAGTAAYNPGATDPERCGDYSDTDVDPTDDMTFWTYQWVCLTANQWAVRVVQLRALPPATPASCAPNTIAQGASNVNIVVTGTSVSGSEFYENFPSYPNRIGAAFSGTGLTVNSVTINTPTQVTVNVSASGAAATGLRNLTITNPDGQVATGNNLLTVTAGSNPVPTTTSISPSSATAGGAGFTLTVNGTNFISGSIVRWNGADRTTTFVSGTQVTASISAADIANAGTATVTVFNPAPGGGTSNGQTFTINNPVPTLTTISPSSGTAGGPAFTLTVNGTNFNSQSVVRWNGNNRTTTFVSSTQITASIPATDIATAGTATVTVFNPTPGGGTSGSATFTINNPVPAVTTISPSSATVGGAAFTLTVNGSNFVSTSVVQWNGSNRTTTFVNANQLTASIPASDLLVAGTFPVRVSNPSPGGGLSGTVNFTVNNPLPTLTSISPASAVSQGPGFTLTVNGTGFVSSSVVRWNGSPRTTTFVNATQLTASITAADIAAAGTFPITVFNSGPGGGTSGSLNFTVTATTISGTVVLQDYPFGNKTLVPITMELRNNITNAIVATTTVFVNGSDQFTWILNVPAGTYHVRAKASHWLAQKRLNQVISGAESGDLWRRADGSELQSQER